MLIKKDYWFLHTNILPDGKQIALGYKGAVFTVPSDGGKRLAHLHFTVTGMLTRFAGSKDGKRIAFASDRNGNLDIYVMPSEGGRAKRLTYHSANDIPQDFSQDGKQVLFTSARQDSTKSTIFLPHA